MTWYRGDASAVRRGVAATYDHVRATLPQRSPCAPLRLHASHLAMRFVTEDSGPWCASLSSSLCCRVCPMEAVGSSSRLASKIPCTSYVPACNILTWFFRHRKNYERFRLFEKAFLAGGTSTENAVKFNQSQAAGLSIFSRNVKSRSRKVVSTWVQRRRRRDDECEDIYDLRCPTMDDRLLWYAVSPWDENQHERRACWWLAECFCVFCTIGHYY